MGKVTVSMIVSIDGYVASKDRGLDWMFPHVGPDLQARILADLERTDTILIGRATYEGMSAIWPDQHHPLADLMNALPKLVFSTTLDKVEWNNSRLADDDPMAEIRKLRSKSDNELKVLGGANLTQTLTRLGVIDEYQLVVVPAVLGAGVPLFADPATLALKSSATFDGNTLLNVYLPA